MKKLLSKLKRRLIGTVNTDVKPSIGIPMVRTVSNTSAQLYEVTGYNNPLNK